MIGAVFWLMALSHDSVGDILHLACPPVRPPWRCVCSLSSLKPMQKQRPEQKEQKGTEAFRNEMFRDSQKEQGTAPL